MKKSKTRIFVDKSISSNLMIYIRNKQHHFLKNVLRAKINDHINIFDGITGEWETSIIAINRDNTVLKVVKNVRKMKKLNDIWLIFAPIKQFRMGIVIQKATELGVTKIIPCITEFTNIREVNLNNLFLNAIEAAEQSKRLDVPVVEKQVDINLLLSEWPNDRKLICCDETTNCEKSLIDSLLPFKGQSIKWAVFVGPEGGFSNREKELISKNNNAIKVSLGRQLLRSDTAITVSLFCIQQLFDK